MVEPNLHERLRGVGLKMTSFASSSRRHRILVLRNKPNNYISRLKRCGFLRWQPARSKLWRNWRLVRSAVLTKDG